MDPQTNKLSALIISLLKGVVYRDGDEALWQSLGELQIRVRGKGRRSRGSCRVVSSAIQ